MKKAIFIVLVICLNSCYHFVYKINIDDTKDFKATIIDTEILIKKIEVLPKYKNSTYPMFRFENGGIDMLYTTLNYNPVDSIREGRNNPNSQRNVDTCNVMPGLTIEEWVLLKKNLRKLEYFGITRSDDDLYANTELQYFLYSYIYPDNWEYRDIGYLTLLSKEIINTKNFKQRFKIMDEKDGSFATSGKKQTSTFATK